MIRQHRIAVAVVLAAIAFVGIASAIKLQQEQEQPTLPAPTSTTTPKIAPTFFGTKKPVATKTPAPKPVVPTDGITAAAYLVGDLTTGEILLEKNVNAVLPFASMSKLITALVSTTEYASSTPITITPEEAAVGVDAPDISGIREGETYTAQELIYPLLMSSSNIAAEALASSSDRREFMTLMNGYSWEIGMPHAFFEDPSGLDKLNSGTATGFFAMAQYIFKSRRDLFRITTIASTSVATTTDHGSHVIYSIHPFVNDPRFLGGKTGHTTAAMYTMLTILQIGDRQIAFIVLKSEDRVKDTNLLITKLAKSNL